MYWVPEIAAVIAALAPGQDNYRDGCRNCAAAIRLLKDKGQ